jgi:hypothetical protein
VPEGDDSIVDEDDTWHFLKLICDDDVMCLYVMEHDGNSEKSCEFVDAKFFFGNMMMLFRLRVFEVYPIILDMLLESGNGVFFPQGIMEMGI